MNTSSAAVLCAAAVVVGACATLAAGPTASQSAASEPPPRRDIRHLTILPSTKTVCPGQPIAAGYQARLSDASRVLLGPDELSRLTLRGIAAEPRPDGSWQTHADPIESAVTGFRLSAALSADPEIHADTVVVPTYQCLRTAISLPISDRYRQAKAHVRVGVFATPFYDSIVVAAVEPEGDAPFVIVLGPDRIRGGALQISAEGKSGKPGRAGSAGTDGGPCEDGEAGTDGDDGEAGEAGGEVDVILEAGVTWLAPVVNVSNSGGRGGSGGPGGRGGRAGSRSDRPGCNPKAGRSGRAGRSGNDGLPGPYPRTTTVIRSLLWRGSPVWSDSASRAALEALMELDGRRR